MSEKRPAWNYVFENDTMKINTNDNFVDPEILHNIQDMGFRIIKIEYLEKLGIIFSIVEESLDCFILFYDFLFSCFGFSNNVQNSIAFLLNSEKFSTFLFQVLTLSTVLH